MNSLACIIKQARDYCGTLSPAKLVFGGYLFYVLSGWLLLCLPFMQKGPGVKALDNLFVATSAMSTTGLSTVSVWDCYNFLGQLVVLGLIQLGGIGYMTLGSFVILSRKSGLSEIRSRVGAMVFSLPVGFDLAHFIRGVIGFTFAIELLGTMVLYPIFLSVGAPCPLWNAVFHSVSAFCTAGFSLFNNSFESYATHFWLNSAIAVLSYLGAIGFIVCLDFWRMVRGEVEHITLTSKIILYVTFWMTLCGTLLIFLGEPLIAGMPADERLLAAFFQAMSAMTTVGFNTVGIGTLSKASLLVIIVLMVIGASPSGTGGGLKSTTLSAILGVIRSAIRGEHDVRFWGKVVPLERIWTAVASLGMYLGVLVIGTYLLELTETSGFEKNLFEASSALGTVGLSMGITSTLTNMGKLIVIFLMFCGRLGPLTLGVALYFPKGLMSEVSDSDVAL